MAFLGLPTRRPPLRAPKPPGFLAPGSRPISPSHASPYLVSLTPGGDGEVLRIFRVCPQTCVESCPVSSSQTPPRPVKGDGSAQPSSLPSLSDSGSPPVTHLCPQTDTLEKVLDPAPVAHGHPGSSRQAQTQPGHLVCDSGHTSFRELLGSEFQNPFCFFLEVLEEKKVGNQYTAVPSEDQ